jgi:hypothetical protein
MGFLPKWAAILAGISAIVLCSCEEHRLGEMPEVQREHVDLANASDEVPLVPTESDSERPRQTPTPAEFFPESSPH